MCECQSTEKKTRAENTHNVFHNTSSTCLLDEGDWVDELSTVALNISGWALRLDTQLLKLTNNAHLRCLVLDDDVAWSLILLSCTSALNNGATFLSSTIGHPSFDDDVSWTSGSSGQTLNDDRSRWNGQCSQSSDDYSSDEREREWERPWDERRMIRQNSPVCEATLWGATGGRSRKTSGGGVGSGGACCRTTSGRGTGGWGGRTSRMMSG